MITDDTHLQGQDQPASDPTMDEEARDVTSKVDVGSNCSSSNGSSSSSSSSNCHNISSSSTNIAITTSMTTAVACASKTALLTASTASTSSTAVVAAKTIAVSTKHPTIPFTDELGNVDEFSLKHPQYPACIVTVYQIVRDLHIKQELAEIEILDGKAWQRNEYFIRAKVRLTGKLRLMIPFYLDAEIDLPW